MDRPPIVRPPFVSPKPVPARPAETHVRLRPAPSNPALRLGTPPLRAWTAAISRVVPSAKPPSAARPRFPRPEAREVRAAKPSPRLTALPSSPNSVPTSWLLAAGSIAVGVVLLSGYFLAPALERRFPVNMLERRGGLAMSSFVAFTLGIVLTLASR